MANRSLLLPAVKLSRGWVRPGWSGRGARDCKGVWAEPLSEFW
jgi:hypothetical protein